MAADEQMIRDAVAWLREHAKYMSSDVRDGYDGIIDGLDSLLSHPCIPVMDHAPSMIKADGRDHTAGRRGTERQRD